MMSEIQVNYINAHKASVKRQAERTAAICASFLIPHLRKLPPNFKFLDLGCGPGSITLDLAQLFPEATFLGIDGGEAPIAQAQTLLDARGVTNTSFRVGDILKLTDESDFPWGTFDAVYCHQVLLHMQQPVEGLKVMRRAAKPDGGLVAARESFTSGQIFRPDESGLLKRLGGVMAELLRKNGSEPEIGAKLIEKAKEAGWKRSQIEPSFGLWDMTIKEEKSGFAGTVLYTINEPNSGARKRALEAGLLDEETIKGMTQALENWLSDDVAWGTYVNGEIICTNGS